MLQAINPATGRIVREVAAADSEACDRVLEAAAIAFETWRFLGFAERSRVLHAVGRRMREDVERLARLMTEEMGKPIREARGEVAKAAWCAEHYAANAERYLASDPVESDASRSYVQYLPLGPVLGILPWNAPFWLAFRFCAPALMAGNPCVMKHDPHVPGCAEAIARVFEEVGAPPGIMANLPLETKDVEAAIRDRRIRAVSFTGSPRGGAEVASIAASEIKPSVLELGGSDPAIVLADAELEAAADAIVLSRIINAGQSCIAAKRIIVEAPVHDRFVIMVKDRLEKLVLGDPGKEATDIGPIAREDLREALHDQVVRSLGAGARCLLGGKIPEGPGFFYPPTLLTDVRQDMAAGCEETFGPVAAVIRADDADHALALANDSDFGLAAAIWTDAARGEAMASRLMTGQVAVNGLVKTDPRLPSGGVKRSGYGRELGAHGIHAFVNVQQIWIGPART